MFVILIPYTWPLPTRTPRINEQDCVFVPPYLFYIFGPRTLAQALKAARARPGQASCRFGA